MTLHTDKQYELELQKLKDEILKMGGIVEEMIARSMQSLVVRDSNLAKSVINDDPHVNHLEMNIDEDCIHLLALRQPAASDLRFIIIGLKINKDLERMGDLAVNIAQKTLEINTEEALPVVNVLSTMGTEVQKMVKLSLDALVRSDAAAAKTVCEMDDLVDKQNKDIQQDLVKEISKIPAVTAQAVRYLLIARHLERVADHATNIAEEVIYMVKGLDIRHGKAIA